MSMMGGQDPFSMGDFGDELGGNIECGIDHEYGDKFQLNNTGDDGDTASEIQLVLSEFADASLRLGEPQEEAIITASDIDEGSTGKLAAVLAEVIVGLRKELTFERELRLTAEAQLQNEFSTGHADEAEAVTDLVQENHFLREELVITKAAIAELEFRKERNRLEISRNMPARPVQIQEQKTSMARAQESIGLGLLSLSKRLSRRLSQGSNIQVAAPEASADQTTRNPNTLNGAALKHYQFDRENSSNISLSQSEAGLDMTSKNTFHSNVSRHSRKGGNEYSGVTLSMRLRKAAEKGELTGALVYERLQGVSQCKYLTKGSSGSLGFQLVSIPNPTSTLWIHRVTTVFPGQPGEKAGVRTGDAILAVDGTEALSMPHDETVDMLRRAPETFGIQFCVLSDLLAALDGPRLALV